MRKKFRELKDKVPFIQSLESKLTFNVLNDEQIENIHKGTMRILENVGVNIPSEKALDIFEDAGADVDRDNKIVKIPREIVEDAMEKAPRNYTLAGRDEKLDLDLDGEHTYLDVSGCGTKTIDFETRKLRQSRKDDVAKMALVSDYLPNVSFYWPMVSAQDVPKTAPLEELEASYRNTQKHVQTETAITEDLAKRAVEMASLIAGGRDKLRERPILSALICCVDPLGQDADGLEAGLVYAEAGVPVGYMAMVTMGLSSPASPAATLVVGNAEVLSALTMIQLAHPGAPVFYSLIPAVAEPRTAAYEYGHPTAQLTNAAAMELGHSYGIPTFCGASYGGSAHQVNQWQVGRENVYLALFSALNKSDIACGQGLMDASNLLYPERIIYDNEIFQAVNQITSGLEVTPETLKLDLIEEIGPRGQFMATIDTVKNLTDLWPRGILHEPSDDPEETFLDPADIAIEELEWILENHKPEPLKESVDRDLKELLQQARNDYE